MTLKAIAVESAEGGKVNLLGYDKPGEYQVILRPADPAKWKTVNVWKMELAPAK